MVDGYEYPSERLERIAAELRDGKEVESITVRQFLWWWFAERRGHVVVWNIRRALRDAGLETDPDFAGAYIGSRISFKLTAPDVEEAQPIATEEVIEIREFSDPTYRISRLAAANQQLVTVAPDAEVKTAVTLMLTHDFSQLPVMQGEREVKGIITWASVGARLALNRSCLHVRECMESHHEVRANASLFSAIALIAKHQYVLVRGGDNKITGIVTSTDLTLQFQQLSEPFLLLGEIENHIRRLISAKFSKEELLVARDPADEERQVDSVSDLTLGECIRLIEVPANWERIAISLDRRVFAEKLQRVRTIRNDVMHFDPDGIVASDLDALRDFSRFLQTLQEIGI